MKLESLFKYSKCVAEEKSANKLNFTKNYQKFIINALFNL